MVRSAMRSAASATSAVTKLHPSIGHAVVGILTVRA